MKYYVYIDIFDFLYKTQITFRLLIQNRLQKSQCHGSWALQYHLSSTLLSSAQI